MLICLKRLHVPAPWHLVLRVQRVRGPPTRPVEGGAICYLGDVPSVAHVDDLPAACRKSSAVHWTALGSVRIRQGDMMIGWIFIFETLTSSLVH